MDLLSRIIIDTDIGTNADDAVAVALALRSPEIRIEGLTTVYGQVHARAQIARSVLKLCGTDHIPVFPGVASPLLRNRPLLRAGIEGHGPALNEALEPERHAVEFIIQQILDHPGEITLVTIGPLTNVATALILEPRVAKQVKRIVMMGGVTRLAANGAELDAVEHNIQCDPEAASVVFSSGAPILMVGLDVTRQARFTRDEARQMAQCATPLAVCLVEMMHAFMDYMERDFSYMCDPLTIAALIDPSLIRTSAMDIEVVYDHRASSGQTLARLHPSSPIEVALELDKDRFFKLLHQRLFS
ncbi:nucleoside hydrolase [Paenibacillus senegalimassiliensis]|uniref:nucleoside hydrolase n=1 Tax=Paenibacillus senegalimassiliensis TaxID=1737426 RepID=UPI000B1C0D58|nr:nucleoside hydrolase [Paenibacillus senegalimassiliensis]